MSFFPVSRLPVMMRYVAIIVLAAIPIAWAAPLPREVTGLNAWAFTRDDLAKLPYPPESEALNATEKEFAPNAGELALGLHINGNSFVCGQSIPALIVIKNLQDKDAGLDMRFEFYDTPLFLNSCNITIIDCKTKSKQPLSLTKCWQCGSGSLCTVPAKGYLCHRADFGMTAHGPLPAGEYECHWNFGRLRSNIVRFTVTEPKTAEVSKAVPKRSRTTVLQIMTYSKDAEIAKTSDDQPAGNIVFNNTGLDRHRVEALALALGSGVKDQYYPNIREIPAADNTIKLETTWTKHKDRDQLVVTLKSVKGDQRVQFSREPTVYLLIEAADREVLDEKAYEREKDAASKTLSLETPLTFDIRLADTWKERSGQSGKVKVRVLVCSERLDLERWSGLKMSKQVLETKVLKGQDVAPIWAGVLLSGEQTFDLPALKAKKDE